MPTQTKLKDLNQFTGTEHYYKLSVFSNFNCTDGVKYVAEEAGAYWLIDAIVSYQHLLTKQDFQHWKLKVTGSKAVLTCDDGNSDEALLVTQNIEFTDFPHDISFYLTDNVLMLPSEY